MVWKAPCVSPIYTSDGTDKISDRKPPTAEGKTERKKVGGEGTAARKGGLRGIVSEDGLDKCLALSTAHFTCVDSQYCTHKPPRFPSCAMKAEENSSVWGGGDGREGACSDSTP